MKTILGRSDPPLWLRHGLTLCAMVGLLSGCGQKGPLFLPPPNAVAAPAGTITATPALPVGSTSTR